MLDLRLQLSLAANYRSPSQRIRVVTEEWVAKNTGCPACSQAISKVANNSPGLDFVCRQCDLAFELKSKRGFFGDKLVDGAYESMMSKIRRNAQSNFFLLNYDGDYLVTDLVLIPKRFIVPEIIECRPPLSPRARRAGWIGCNLKVSLLPAMGRIAYVKDRSVVSPGVVLAQWQKTNFLEDVSFSSRGWLIAVMSCIERIDRLGFTLEDVYSFVPHLQSLFPRNRHIKAKIRQQLQVLRDRGWLAFRGNGKYERTVAP